MITSLKVAGLPHLRDKTRLRPVDLARDEAGRLVKTAARDEYANVAIRLRLGDLRLTADGGLARLNCCRFTCRGGRAVGPSFRSGSGWFLLSSALADVLAALFLPSILRAIATLDVSVGSAFVALLAGTLTTNFFLTVLQGSTPHRGAIAPSFGMFGLFAGLAGTGVSYLILQTLVARSPLRESTFPGRRTPRWQKRREASTTRLRLPAREPRSQTSTTFFHAARRTIGRFAHSTPSPRCNSQPTGYAESNPTTPASGSPTTA